MDLLRRGDRKAAELREVGELARADRLEQAIRRARELLGEKTDNGRL